MGSGSDDGGDNCNECLFGLLHTCEDGVLPVGVVNVSILDCDLTYFLQERQNCAKDDFTSFEMLAQLKREKIVGLCRFPFITSAMT